MHGNLEPKDLRRHHHEMVQVVEDLKKQEAKVIAKLQDIDRYFVYRYLGYNSLFTYATQALRLTEAQAYAFISVARKAAQFPVLQKAIIAGEISVSKAVRIASVLNDNNQEEWVELAKTRSKREVEKAVATVNPKLVQASRVRYLDANYLELQLPISEEIYAKLERVRELVAQANSQPASLEETLDAALDFFLKKKDPLAQRDPKSPKKTLPGHSDVDHSTARPARLKISIKKAVLKRDRGQCQICGERQWLDVHHINPRENGGNDDLSNLATVCRGHHRSLHARGLSYNPV